MKSYQLVLVLKTSLSEAERKKTIEAAKEWLKGLKITSQNEWGQKALSYSIKKQKDGFYMDLAIEGENIPSDFEKRLINSEGVLRHLLIRGENSKIKSKN